jgi:hypothetical protein
MVASPGIRLIRFTTQAERGPVADRLLTWRVVADRLVIDRLPGRVLRLAADEALVIGGDEIVVDDPDAIVVRDTGWVYLAVSEGRALDLIAAHASWQPPPERPSFAQGMLAGLPAKVYLAGDESKLIVAAAFAHELEERLGE